MRTAYMGHLPCLIAGCTLLSTSPLPAYAGTDQRGRLIQSIISQHKLPNVNTLVMNKSDTERLVG